jgi:hypothetical protein
VGQRKKLEEKLIEKDAGERFLEANELLLKYFQVPLVKR